MDCIDTSSSDALAPEVDPIFMQLKFLSDDDISAVKEELVRKMEAHATADSSDSPSSDSSTVTTGIVTLIHRKLWILFLVKMREVIVL